MFKLFYFIFFVNFFFILDKVIVSLKKINENHVSQSKNGKSIDLRRDHSDVTARKGEA